MVLPSLRLCIHRQETAKELPNLSSPASLFRTEKQCRLIIRQARELKNRRKPESFPPVFLLTGQQLSGLPEPGTCNAKSYPATYSPAIRDRVTPAVQENRGGSAQFPRPPQQGCRSSRHDSGHTPPLRSEHPRPMRRRRCWTRGNIPR